MGDPTINHVKLDRDITILSDPQAVNMADEWFDIVNLDDFLDQAPFRRPDGAPSPSEVSRRGVLVRLGADTGFSRGK